MRTSSDFANLDLGPVFDDVAEVSMSVPHSWHLMQEGDIAVTKVKPVKLVEKDFAVIIIHVIRIAPL